MLAPCAPGCEHGPLPNSGPPSLKLCSPWPSRTRARRSQSTDPHPLALSLTVRVERSVPRRSLAGVASWLQQSIYASSPTGLHSLKGCTLSRDPLSGLHSQGLHSQRLHSQCNTHPRKRSRQGMQGSTLKLPSRLPSKLTSKLTSMFPSSVGSPIELPSQRDCSPGCGTAPSSMIYCLHIYIFNMCWNYYVQSSAMYLAKVMLLLSFFTIYTLPVATTGLSPYYTTGKALRARYVPVMVP